jgi:hypothetical protein
MTLDFDLNNVTLTEFGVGRDDGGDQSFVAVPVDADVQTALREMAAATWEAMRGQIPAMYEPSEKYQSIQYVYLPITDELASILRELHEAVNLGIDSKALDDPAKLFCYFARLTDNKRRRLTGLRRASHFKGILKSRLIRLVTDSLKLIDDHVFKLDADFDLLIDSAAVHILRPSGFEYAAKLREAILAAVPQNIELLEADLDFVEFEGIQEYASKHPRAARYLASIQSQKAAKAIDQAALKKLCKSTRVQVTERNGLITVDPGHEMGFLEVLDRRRYELELVKGRPERFKAASRRRI